jgi:Protein of unknown function (DUF1214)
MIMRLTDIGSQYLIDFVDSEGEYFDGSKTYKVTLPANIPAGKFWSFTVYDNQTRSMLDTPQRYPRAGSQSFPTPAAEASADRMMSMGHERRSTGPHRGGPPRAASRVAAAICAQGCEDALFGRSLV